MRSSLLSVAAVLLGVCSAIPAEPTAPAPAPKVQPAAAAPKADADGKYWIHGTGISAAFVPYGASISNLLVKDKNGIVRDVVTGFDNATHYTLDTQHGHFGGVPGRYANRIKNSTFELDGVKYKIAPNDNKTPEHPQGLNTLHGGPDGWDWRNFTVVSHTNSSVTFSIVDPDGKEGFPGEVISYITYSLGDMSWDFKMVAIATTKKTPIMLTNHAYFNLDGFANDQTNLALNHTFHLPYSGQRVDVDNILIPTGDLLANKKGSVNDFWSKPKQIGASFNDPEIHGNCGYNCTGYDNCWLVDRSANGPYNWRKDGYVASLHSEWSGIKLEIFSDQEAFQMYTCNFQDGTMALKKTQGLFDNPKFPRTIPKYGCLVLEVQEWIDAINQPQWGRGKRQIFEPGGDPYVLQASYRFSIA